MFEAFHDHNIFLSILVSYTHTFGEKKTFAKEHVGKYIKKYPFNVMNFIRIITKRRNFKRT